MIPDPSTAETPFVEDGSGNPAGEGPGTESPSPAGRICYSVDCGRPVVAHGLCRHHYDAIRKGSRSGNKKATEPAALPPVVVACPDDLIPLVTQLVENDARPLFMLLWRAIGTWHLQGRLEDSA